MLKKLLAFSRLLNDFSLVERSYYIPHTSRKENDAEHSYQLATCAWYLIDTHNLKLDKEKVFRYALAHDLVELHAGDTYIYDADHVASKKEREAAAAKQLEEDLPEFPQVHEAIKAYEKREDPRAASSMRLIS